MFDSKEIELMRIGKLTLISEEWSWGVAIKLEHESINNKTNIDDGDSETVISISEARELIGHLERFISMNHYASQ